MNDNTHPEEILAENAARMRRAEQRLIDSGFFTEGESTAPSRLDADGPFAHIIDLMREEANTCEREGVGVAPAALKTMAAMLERRVGEADGSGTPRLNTDLRGDGPCGDCGTFDNIVWHAPNGLWNAVCRPPGYEVDPILCIRCFVARAAGVGVKAPGGWRLEPGADGSGVASRAAQEHGTLADLRKALAWARSEILDRSMHESSNEDYPVPDHECWYYRAPDGGVCSWCDRWAELNAALDQHPAGGTLAGPVDGDDRG